MITFSNLVSQILSQPSIKSFYAIKIADYYTTTHYSNITLSNGETYLSDGRILAVTPPQFSATVDTEKYGITLIDPDFFFKDRFSNQVNTTGLVGQEVIVRLGFLDTQTEEPLLDLVNTILVYKGKIDSTTYNIRTENVGSIEFSISCSSPMANLDGVKAFYGSKQFIRSLYSDDSSFDQVYEGSGDLLTKWGKK